MLRRSLRAASLAVFLAPLAKAQTYYSIDVNNDVLCIVNVTTGVATPVGPVQVDLGSVALAWHQGALYAKTQGTSSGTKICQIVTDGQWIGYALQGAFLNGGTYQGAEAASIASDGSQLCLSYYPNTPTDFNSIRFGSVNPIWAGTITNIGNLIGDIDGMTFCGGHFWGIDVVNSTSGYDLYWSPTGNPGVGPTALLGGDTYDNTLATNPVQPAEDYLDASQLVCMGQTGQNLVRINKSNGKRSLVTPITGLMSGGALSGLALRPNPCGPFIIHHVQ